MSEHTGVPLLRARPRRLRSSLRLRALAAETRLSAEALVHPLFVCDGGNVRRDIPSMPGCAQLSADNVLRDVDEAQRLGVRAFLLFGIPPDKDATGSSAWNDRGPVAAATRAIKEHSPDTVVIADVCMCEYTSHGHCGVLDASGRVDNDATLSLLGRAANCYAAAGADIVAPSAMMDGQVAAIRLALDGAGHANTAILSYAVKYASALYGPFREAAGSTPASGDRRGYQMDPPNIREAMREAALDVTEGADMLMVKPAGLYLDVIRAVRERVDVPLAAYQVSGEYAMIKAAAERGWVDERRVATEALLAMRRAGADVLITYFAMSMARWLAEDHGTR